MRVLNTQIAVKAVAEEEVSSSGIIVEKAPEQTAKGKVLFVGEEVKEIKVDDVVVFKKYDVNEFTVGNDKYLVLNEEDVLAILND